MDFYFCLEITSKISNLGFKILKSLLAIMGENTLRERKLN